MKIIFPAIALVLGFTGVSAQKTIVHIPLKPGGNAKDPAMIFTLDTVPVMIPANWNNKINIIYPPGARGNTIEIRGRKHTISITPEAEELCRDTLHLIFQQGALIGRGKKVVENMLIDTDSVFIRLAKKDGETEVKQVGKSYLDKLQFDAARSCSLPTDTGLLKPFIEKLICSPVRCCEKPEGSAPFTDPDFWKRTENGSHIHLYRIIVDNRDNKVVYYNLKYNKKKERYEESSIWPKVYKDVEVTVIGPAGSEYVIDSSAIQLHLDDDSKFTTAISSFQPTGAASPVKTDSATETGTPDEIENATKKMKPLLTDVIVVATKTKARSSIDSLLSEFEKIYKKGKKLSPRLYGDIKNLILALRDRNDSLTARNAILLDSLRILTARLDSVIHVQDTWDRAMAYKHKLLALDMALEQFNYRFRNIDLQEETYRKDLLCLQLGIKAIFGIGISDNADDLANQLAAKVFAQKIDSCYFMELGNLIAKVRDQYKPAIGKEAKNRMFTKTIPVPNSDLLKVIVRNGKNSAPFFYAELPYIVGNKSRCEYGHFSHVVKG